MNSIAGRIKERHSPLLLLSVIGVASAILYGYALWLGNLRLQTIPFEWVFFVLFGLYLLAAWQVLQAADAPASRRGIVLIFSFAIIYRAILIFSQPALSDDMYRYIWDGRVQSHQINPYTYPPNSPELVSLRDSVIWPWINRKEVITIYPAGAQLAFAAIWRIWPDTVRWVQAVMTFGDLISALLLYFLLRAMGRSPGLVLIYLWHPLVIFEIAHSAHVDGLVLPFLVGAWLARKNGRDALTGLLLGLAVSLKLYPVLFFPALWRRQDDRGRSRPAWTMPLALLFGFLVPYFPYLSIGKGIVGFLPAYFHEQFNFMLTAPIHYWVFEAGGQPELVISLLIVIVLLVIYLVFLIRPAENAETALRRCLWPMGAYLLMAETLYPWYLLCLVPLFTVFLPARRAEESKANLARRLLFTSWTGWWLFSGLVALSYLHFFFWETVFVVIFVQFVPLYEFLLIDLGRWLKEKILMSQKWKPAIGSGHKKDQPLL